MTCNNIILSQPQAGGTLNHEIPNDVSARLNFGPDDISGLRLGGEGELVISFNGGGQLNITNFDDVIDNGNLLYLEDGTLIDPSILTGALKSPQDFNNIETAAGAATDADAIRIGQPAANTTQSISATSGQKYVCDFDPSNANVEVRDGKMYLTFADGSQIVINNFEQAQLPEGLIPAQEILTEVTEVAQPIEEILQIAEAGEAQQVAEAPRVEVQESVAEQVSQIQPAAGEDLAQQLANIEPAAGETGGASNSGYGFNSSPTDAPFNAPDAIGPLGATQLAYNTPNVNPENPFIVQAAQIDPAPVLSSDPVTLDETNLGTGNVVQSGEVNVNYGGQGPNADGLIPNGDFVATCNVDGEALTDGGFQLSSGGVDVVVTATDDGYIGTAGGVTVFTFVIDPETGEFDYTQIEPFDHSDTNDTNEAICLDFGVQVTDTTGDTRSTNVRVNVLDDAPVLTSQPIDIVDETDFANGQLVTTGNFSADMGEDVGGSYTGNDNGFNVSGSVAGNNLTSNGVDVEVTFDAATNTYTGTAGGETVFTMVVDPATGDYTYTQFGPLDHADATDPNDAIDLNFDVTVTDFDGDSATGQIRVRVLDDAPITGDDVNTIDETSLDGGDIVITDSVDVDFGNDGQGALVPNGTFTAGGSLAGGTLTSNGVEVVVTKTDNGYVGVAGGVTVFELEIDPTTGDYTFTLKDNLDHADGNDDNDVISLNFGTIITDYDGDSDAGQITINIRDDAPEANDDKLTIEEGETQTGNVITNNDEVGADDPGTITNVRFEGVDYPVAENGTTVIEGNYGTLTIESNGDYSYVAGNVDGGVVAETSSLNPTAADAAGTQNSITKDGITITAGDGKDISFFDAGDLGSGFGVSGKPASDLVFNGETLSADFTNPVDVATFSIADIGDNNIGSTFSYEVRLEDGSVINQMFTIEAGDVVDGVVTFTVEGFDSPIAGVDLLGGPSYVLSDVNTQTFSDAEMDDQFEYTLVDSDGDSDTAILEVCVKNDPAPINIMGVGSTDDTNLSGGNDVETGVINVNYQGDGPGVTTGNGDFASAGNRTGNKLTSNGVDVDVTFDEATNTYTGSANGQTVFTMVIGADGEYTFTQSAPLDHSNTNSNNEAIFLDFGVTATDSDGDTGTGNVRITVRDDAPEANDDALAVQESGTATGNVIGNDDQGQDGSGVITQVVFEGVTTAVPANGTVDIVGNYGTLTIAADGTYSYTAIDDNPDGVDEFIYTLRDFDGDTDTAKLSITVSKINDIPVVNPEIKTVDETDGTDSVSGTINVDFGGDAPGEVNPNGNFDASVPNLTSCGHDVNVTLDGNTYTGTANGQTVFTMTINEDGSYTFNQLEAIDHPNTVNDNDVVNLVFGATATDSDDDSVNTSVTIRVLDDGPEIDNTTQEVDEGDIANGQNLVATGEVVADFGQDGPGEITANGLFEAKFQRDGANVTLSSGGNAISVTNTDNVYTGTANGQVVFTLAIDPATGAYTYTQMGPIDHPDDQDPDDVIWLKFYADITDCDGDHDTGVIVIDVHDDAPVAVNDTDTVAEGKVATGNVLDNDDAGADSDASVVEVQFNGQTFAVPATGSTTVTGQYGELTIKADGTYSYEANTNNPDGVDRFTYVMQDGDGDRDTAQLSITVTSVDGVPTIEQRNVPYYEDVLEDGKITINGTLDFDFGADGPGEITPNGMAVTRFELGGVEETLTSGGVEVVFTQTANGYIGKAGNVTVITLEIDPQTGEYTYQQCAPVDHPETGEKNGDEVIWVKFGVQITDADGDTAETVINFDIVDDNPEAVDDTDAAAEGETVTGNVLDNDDVGVDGNGMVCEVKFGNQTFAVPATGSVKVTGQYGELTIKADGSYSYKANNNNPDGVDVFTYTMKDQDGDTSSADLSITVTNINDVPTITTSVTGVNEVDLCDHPLVVNKTFVHDFGDDGAGKIEVNGNTAVKFKVGGQDQTLTSNGVEVVISQSGNGYVGKAGNLTVFTMTLNGQTGEYTYTQFAGVDHPGVGKAGTDDVIWLKLGVSITDSDGDSANAYVNIDIRDTAPEANDDTNAVAEGERETGNVLTNDVNCEDGSTVCEVVFNGQTFTVPDTGTVRVDGQYGTLRINANGGYTYTANDNNPDGVDVFTYTMKDQDGDTSSADLSITVTSVNDVPTITTSVTGVNEADLCDHPLVVNKTFVHDFGDDGAGRFEANGNTAVKFKVGGQNQTLTSSGKAVVITNTADGYVGKAGGETVFTLDLNQQTGEYTYTQFASVDHPGVGATGTNDVIWLKLGVSIFDKDGDRADAYVNIDIRDDAPTAVNDKVFAGGSATFDTLDLNLSSSDVAGTQSSFARDGISINSNNGADLVWVNHTGPGVGIAGEGTNKVFREAEVLEVNFATAVTAATITLGDMGANNVGDNFKYEVFLSDGTSVVEAVVIQGNGLVGETFKFDVEGYDAGIVGVDLIGGPSFLLNDVQASSVDYTAGDAQGNVLLNDDNACGDNTVVTTISFEGRDYSVPANGDRTINGDNGKLTINAKGEYTYVSNTSPAQTVHSFNINNPDGSARGGDIKNVSTQYNETTKDFTFTMVTDTHADGVTFAVNDGPNPKDHPGELAFFYIDGTGAEPVVTVYGYNGAGSAIPSWTDGSSANGTQSPDKIFSSITNPELFDAIVATTNGDGTKTYSVSLNVEALQNHDPVYGPNGIWEGVEFGDKIGIWSHTYSDLHTSYGNDGFLTDWGYNGLGYYDSSDSDTHTTTIPGQSTGGDDTFTYTIRDEDGDTSTATLEICVKDFDNVIEITGNGNFYGTDDADMFLFNALGAAGAARLNNFNLDEDAVDLGNVIQGFDPLTDAINDFVFVTENNGDTVIQIDADGVAGGARENVARLDGVTGESLEDLIENGNIIV